MPDAVCNPYLRIALPTAVAFAGSVGLTARLLERFGEYIEVRWQEASLSKTITISSTPRGFEVRVEATARDSVEGRKDTSPTSRWTWRDLGAVDLSDRDRVERLKQSLAEAWKHLKGLGPADVEREYGQVVGHAMERVKPILDSFAAAQKGRMDVDPIALGFHFVLSWPKPDPLYRLTLDAGPKYGFSVGYEVRDRQRRGLFCRRPWTGPGFREVSRGIYEDVEPPLRVDDWKDLEGLDRLLADAAKRAELLGTRMERG
jgi:hypothetical protein